MSFIIPVSAVIALFPLSGISFSDYILSLNPCFSIGTIAYFIILLWKRFADEPLISERNMVLFAAWNVVVCLFLYTSYLGFVDIDLYPLGYGFSFLFVIVACLTVLLVLLKNPLSYVFISYIVAYDLNMLISQNYFDYITDTLLFFISIGILIEFLVSRFRGKNCTTVCRSTGSNGVYD